MKKIVQLLSVFLTVALVISIIPSISRADETEPAQDRTDIRNDWIDEDLGPGVARWVDGNGQVSDQPGKQETQSQETETEAAVESTEVQQTETTTAVETETTGQTETGAAADSEQSQTVRTIDPNKPMVALTFDDGPYAPVGNRVMDCLNQYGGKATFFVVGNRAAAYKTELKRMAAEGFEIGNHTYDHKYLTKLNAAQIQYQIHQCNDAVQAVCGVRPTLVRLPGGLKNSTVLANVHFPMIMWSIDTRDWKTRNARKTVNAVVGKVHDGDIILMHEIYSQSGDAALEIIPKLTQAGYQLVTVSELAKYRGGVASGGVYYRFHR
jgi:peptidoglycan-N-acetylglucosamine deacetylase